MATVTDDQVLSNRFRVVVYETKTAMVKGAHQWRETDEEEITGKHSKESKWTRNREHVKDPDSEKVVCEMIYDQRCDELDLPALVAVINGLTYP